MQKYIAILLIVAVAFLSFFVFESFQNAPKREVASPTPAPTNIVEEEESKSPPNMAIDQNKEYQAVLTTTEGKITIKLNAKQTPITVNNFVYLARSGFYNGTVFHRTINGFMIQGGDPLGTGGGGPGYTFDDEPFEGEYTRGTVAMANSGPNTNGSQFFIMHQQTPLPKDYVIFGEVTSGLDVVDKIATAPVKPSTDTPASPVTIKSVVITEE
jgi:cyclophilin family peptidyl-prolyl cis-trans isomerase